MADKRKWTRRSVLGGIAGATGVAASSLGGDGEGKLTGGAMSLDQAFNVAGSLWIGPDSAKSEVPIEDGRVYKAVDTQVEYYGDADAGSWQLLGVGSEAQPVPNTHSELVSTEELQTEKYPRVNVKAYGAVGDGSTDDTQAMRDALDAATTEDVPLFFPPGTYLTTLNRGELLNWTNYTGLEVYGAGRYQSEIKLADNATDTDYGIGILHPGPESHIHHIRLNGNQQNNQPISDDNDGANILQVGEKSHVHDIASINSTGDGCEVGGDNCNIHDNAFFNNYEQDVHLWSSNNEVADNRMHGCLNDGAIRIFTTSTKGGDVGENLIQGNLITDTGASSAGIQVSQDSAVSRDDKIIDNLILRSGMHGIFLESAVDPHIEGNTVIDSTDNGILYSSNAADGEIKDNTIRGSGIHGLRVLNGTTPKIRDNSIEKSQKAGISWTTGSSAVGHLYIKYNDIYDNNQEDAGGGNRGIDVTTDGVAVDMVRMEGNDIDSPDGQNHSRGIFTQTFNGGSFAAIECVNNRVRNTYGDAYTLNGTVAKVGENDPMISLSSPPSSPNSGDEYLDDGTNTGSGTEGIRVYLGGGWVDDVTA